MEVRIVVFRVVGLFMRFVSPALTSNEYLPPRAARFFFAGRHQYHITDS